MPLQDPFLTFSSNFLNRMIQAQQINAQMELAKRREERYDKSLQIALGRVGIESERLALAQAADTRAQAREDRLQSFMTQYQVPKARADIGRAQIETDILRQVFPSEQPVSTAPPTGLFPIQDAMGIAQPTETEGFPAPSIEGGFRPKEVTIGGMKFDIPGQMTTSTKTALEKEVAELNQGILGLETTRNLYEDEYSTIPFKTREGITSYFERWGYKPPEEETFWRITKQQVADYNAWFGQAEQQFLVFRRWATGVAGGPAEMAQIRMAFADPKEKSPTQFKAMLDQAISYRKTYRSSIENRIKSGSILNNETRRQATRDALASIGQPIKDISLPEEITGSDDPFGYLE